MAAVQKYTSAYSNDIYLQQCDLSQVQSERDMMIQKNIL